MIAAPLVHADIKTPAACSTRRCYFRTTVRTGLVSNVPLSEQGTSPGRPAPLIAILPVLVNSVGTLPGPQTPRTSALTPTPCNTTLRTFVIETDQGRPEGVRARQLRPLNVAEVMLAVAPSLRPDKTAVQGRETAPAVTVIDPVAVKFACAGEKVKADAELARPRDIKLKVAIAKDVFMMEIP
jgi:hypothetical protein